MYRVNVVAVAAAVSLAFLAGCESRRRQQPIAAFEGAQLIVGDGRVIEDATLVVETATILQVGGPAEVRVPAGARRVDLAGKAIVPMIINTHVHLSDTRDALIWDLRLRAYYGMIPALSLGTDVYEFIEYAPDDSGCLRFLGARRSITMPEPDAQQCLSGLRPAPKAARRSRSSQRTSSTSSRSASTQGMASTRS